MTVYQIADFAVIDITCDECSELETIVIDMELWNKWNGAQMKGVTDEEHELLTTGTHIGCWEKMFA